MNKRKRAGKVYGKSAHYWRPELKVFTLAEGGAEHCQIDNVTMFVDYAADWVAETLGGNPKGV